MNRSSPEGPLSSSSPAGEGGASVEPAVANEAVPSIPVPDVPSAESVAMSLPELAAAPAPAPALSEEARIAAEKEEVFQQAWQALLRPEKTAWGGLLLLGTMLLFGLSMMGGAGGLLNVLWIVLVVLFHELGHFLAMRALGYQDVRMFFIPFFGGAVMGRSSDHLPWKEGVVLLAGPLPGLVMGFPVLLVAKLTGLTALEGLATLLWVINGFNLLPVAPLDGGKLVQLVLFRRHRFLESGFLFCGGAALLVLAFATQGWVLGFVGLSMLAALPKTVKLLGEANGLRRELGGVPSEASALSEGQVRRLFHSAVELGLPNAAVAPGEQYAQSMRSLHQRLKESSPGFRTSVLLLGVWGASFVALVVAFVLSVMLRRMPGDGGVGS